MVPMNDSGPKCYNALVFQMVLKLLFNFYDLDQLGFIEKLGLKRVIKRAAVFRGVVVVFGLS